MKGNLVIAAIVVILLLGIAIYFLGSSKGTTTETTTTQPTTGEEVNTAEANVPVELNVEVPEINEEVADLNLPEEI